MGVRRSKADAEAPVESAQALSLYLDFVDLLDLRASLEYGQVRPVGQTLCA